MQYSERVDSGHGYRVEEEYWYYAMIVGVLGACVGQILGGAYAGVPTIWVSVEVLI